MPKYTVNQGGQSVTNTFEADYFEIGADGKVIKFFKNTGPPSDPELVAAVLTDATKSVIKKVD